MFSCWPQPAASPIQSIRKFFLSKRVQDLFSYSAWVGPESMDLIFLKKLEVNKTKCVNVPKIFQETTTCKKQSSPTK